MGGRNEQEVRIKRDCFTQRLLNANLILKVPSEQHLNWCLTKAWPSGHIKWTIIDPLSLCPNIQLSDSSAWMLSHSPAGLGVSFDFPQQNTESPPKVRRWDQLCFQKNPSHRLFFQCANATLAVEGWGLCSLPWTYVGFCDSLKIWAMNDVAFKARYKNAVHVCLVLLWRLVLEPSWRLARKLGGHTGQHQPSRQRSD